VAAAAEIDIDFLRQPLQFEVVVPVGAVAAAPDSSKEPVYQQLILVEEAAEGAEMALLEPINQMQVVVGPGLTDWS
jgi:hypothetical protein